MRIDILCFSGRAYWSILYQLSSALNFNHGIYMCPPIHAVEVKVVVCAREGTDLYCDKVILEGDFHVN